jgi:uncharacterized membrane protein
MAHASEFENAEIFVAVYGSESEAQSTLDTIKEMEKQGTLDIIDAATIEKSQDGKVKVHHRDTSTGKGAARGAVVGGVLGVIFPPSILVSALGFGALGAVVGHFRDKPFDNPDLKQIGEEIDPGQAAVIAVVQDKSIEQFATALSGYHKLFRQAVDAQMAGELAVVADKATGEVDATAFVTGQAPPADTSAATAPPPPPDTGGTAASETASSN